MRISVLQTFGKAVGLAVRRPVVLVPFLVPMVLMALMMGLVLGGGETEGEAAALGALGIVLLIGAAVASLWAFPATIALVGRIERGEPAAFGPATRQGLRFLLPFLGLTIVLGVIFTIALFLPGLLLSVVGLGAGLSGLLSSLLSAGTGPNPDLGLSGLSEVSGQAAVGLGAAALIGMVLLGIWGLFLMVKFSLTGAALVLGEVGPLGAIGESWRRSRGAFWRLLGLVLLVGVVGGGIGFVLGLIPVVGLTLGQLLAFYLGTAAFTLAYLRLASHPATSTEP